MSYTFLVHYCNFTRYHLVEVKGNNQETVHKNVNPFPSASKLTIRVRLELSVFSIMLENYILHI